MAHKDKILAALKAKFTKTQGTVLQLVADKLDKVVTNESDIDKSIEDFQKGPITVEDIADHYQRESDKRVTDALKDKDKKDKDQKGEDEKKKKEEEDKKKEEELKKSDDPNAQALLALGAELKAMREEMKSMKDGEVQKSATAKLQERAKAEKIPDYLLPTIKSEEEIDAAIATGKERMGGIKQQLANEGFSQVTPPGGTTVVKVDDKGKADASAVAADVKGFVTKTTGNTGTNTSNEKK